MKGVLKLYFCSRYKNNGKSWDRLTQNQKNGKEKIISAFKNGTLKWELNKCLCGSNDDLILSLKERRGLQNRIVLCKNCGLIRSNPRISEESMNCFYEEFYRNLYFPSSDFHLEAHKKLVFEREYMRGKKHLEFIKNALPLHKGLIFDLGTSTGGMLKAFEEDGYEVFGVDLNEEYLEYGIKRGLNLKKGSIKELKTYPKKANLIIATHVIEHLHNPSNYLSELWECLEDDGYLYVVLPSSLTPHKTFGHFLPFFVIEHLYYFNLKILSKIMGENRFQLIEGTEKIRSLFQKTKKTTNIKISKEFIDNMLIYLKIINVPLPINAFTLIKNRNKLIYRILNKLISIFYRIKIINLFASLLELNFSRKSNNKLFLRLILYYNSRKFSEDQGWVAHFVISALKERKINIYGDGKQVRDVLYISDLIHAFDLYIKKGDQIQHEVFCMGGGIKHTLSLLELINILENELGKEIECEFFDWRPSDQKVYISDIRKAKAKLDWAPKINPKEGVLKLIKWVKSNINLFM